MPASSPKPQQQRACVRAGTRAQSGTHPRARAHLQQVALLHASHRQHHAHARLPGRAGQPQVGGKGGGGVSGYSAARRQARGSRQQQVHRGGRGGGGQQPRTACAQHGPSARVNMGHCAHVVLAPHQRQHPPVSHARPRPPTSTSSGLSCCSPGPPPARRSSAAALARRAARSRARASDTWAAQGSTVRLQYMTAVQPA